MRVCQSPKLNFCYWLLNCKCTWQLWFHLESLLQTPLGRSSSIYCAALGQRAMPPIWAHCHLLWQCTHQLEILLLAKAGPLSMANSHLLEHLMLHLLSLITMSNFRIRSHLLLVSRLHDNVSGAPQPLIWLWTVSELTFTIAISWLAFTKVL